MSNLLEAPIEIYTYHYERGVRVEGRTQSLSTFPSSRNIQLLKCIAHIWSTFWGVIAVAADVFLIFVSLPVVLEIYCHRFIAAIKPGRFNQ